MSQQGVTTRSPKRRPASEPSRRERKKQKQRADLLDVAQKLFLERGFDDVSMSLIAESADVAASTLYNYFPTKRSILVAIAQEDVKGLNSSLEELIPHLPNHPVEALIEEMRIEWSSIRSPQAKDLWRHLIATWILEYETKDESEFVVSRAGYKLFLQALIERWIEQGQICSQADAAALADSVNAIRFDAFCVYISLDQMELEDVLADAIGPLRLVFASSLTGE